MTDRRTVSCILLSLSLVIGGPAFAQEGADPAESEAEALLSQVSKKWTGDLDGMVQRRMIRALVTYSKTYYFVDKGVQRGTAHDSIKAFEDEINKKLKTKANTRVHVFFVPVSREDLIPALREGRGDIAVAGLTITPERAELVAFSEPLWDGVNEIPVTGADGPLLASVEDLSGKEVFVRETSSYWEHLERLNDRFRQEGKPPVNLRPAPEALEDEDILEMVHAGLVKVTVVDSPKAEFWKQIYTVIVPRPEAAVNTGGRIAWMLRKDSPKLKEAVNGFVKTHRKGSAFGNEIFRRYLKSTSAVKRAGDPQELAKFVKLIEIFKKYSGQYNLDPLLMIAQGYQESQLNQQAKSHVGAIGVMQVMPATGKELKVGDIKEVDPNIHAGVKYIRFMIDRYYEKEPMDRLNKGLFAFASYNAGPGRIAQMRKLAAQRGLNPNVWFGNVEAVVSEKVGREPVNYVSNIFKYYVAYTLVVEEWKERERVEESLKQAP
jgi:membrane-bound lytic murein transglycosylase MltF